VLLRIRQKTKVFIFFITKKRNYTINKAPQGYVVQELILHYIGDLNIRLPHSKSTTKILISKYQYLYDNF
jgi:hypothetical protein